MAWYNIPTDPQQRNWMLGGLVALALIIPYQMYVLTPRREDNDILRGRIEGLEVLNRRASVVSAQGGGDLQERLALYERHVARLEELIPAREEVAALIDDVSNRARIMNVEVQVLQPQPPEPGQYYTRTAYNMSVVGEYHDVGRFLAEVASLSRIVTPVQLDLQLYGNADQFRDMESPVIATFQIETFVLPDPSAVPPAPAAPPA
ncbi:MAG: type 4a pilus biogenesis protein PilO [Gemmatimonadales bacterium]